MIFEKGPWSLYNDGEKIGLQSDDFTHDVILWIDGDFGDYEKKKEYAEEIAKRLNSYKVEIKKVDEQECRIETMKIGEHSRIKIVHLNSNKCVEGTTSSSIDDLKEKLLERL